VDRSVQRSLLIAMVALEVVLVGAAIGLAYWHLGNSIDAGMYRMHAAQSGPTLARLAREGFAVLGTFVGVNLIALILAARWWSHHENLVLRDFSALIAKTRELDFSADPGNLKQHEVLSLAAAWRSQERTRFAEFRDQVEKLESAIAAGEPSQAVREAVERLRKQLS
jgi:uncharacterized membrane protein